jgi:hypothetical protein
LRWFSAAREFLLSSASERIEAMTGIEKETLLRRYAAGDITWHELREHGFEDYVQVLGGLGVLGLRPPIAPMTGPNLAARELGRAMIRKALRSHP